MEGVPPLGGDLTDVHHRLGVVAVHVEDGRVHHTRHVRTVGRRPGQPGVGGETDLPAVRGQYGQTPHPYSRATTGSAGGRW